MSSHALSNLTCALLTRRWALFVVLTLLVAACNLGFDTADFPPIEERDAGEDPSDDVVDTGPDSERDTSEDVTADVTEPCDEVGAQEDCYDAGPSAVAGVGICVMGTRTCLDVGGALGWSPCDGAVPPGVESCENMGSDDDCDGTPDDVPDLGNNCDTGLSGDCRGGVWVCEGTALVCDPPDGTDETCNANDDDCDGDTDEGVSNACGGCADLGNEQPGNACGDCLDGELRCNNEDTLTCIGASGFNACGGCTELDNDPDDECGQCGTFVCDGTESVECDDVPFNACGGCGPITDGDTLNDPCGTCGTVVCAPDMISVQCQEQAQNACGGCTSLADQPTDPCGPCLDGTFVCDGTDAVTCVGAGPTNACGGCADLGANLGDPCGTCGQLDCDDNDPDLLECDDPGPNVCGGCGDLPGDVGEMCGTCGTYSCMDTALVCTDPGNNECGGCGVVMGPPLASACGDCGTVVCLDGNTRGCDDPGFNSCFTCGTLDDEGGAACPSCGYFICDAPGTTVCDMRECRPDLNLLRFQHFAPGTDGVDIYVGMTQLVSDLQYTSGTPYAAGFEGSHMIRVFETGADPMMDTPLGTTTVDVAIGEEVSLILAGAPGSLQLIRIVDDNIPIEGAVKMRFINLLPDQASVDVRIDSVTRFSAVDFGTASAYDTFVPAQSLNIRIRLAGMPIDLVEVDVDDPPFVAGEVITLVYTGRESDVMFPPILLHHPSEREWPISP